MSLFLHNKTKVALALTEAVFDEIVVGSDTDGDDVTLAERPKGKRSLMSEIRHWHMPAEDNCEQIV